MNKLLIKGNQVYFEGFEHLTDSITFAFYPRGIVIFNGRKEKREYYLEFEYQNHTITSEHLVEQLKQYHVPDEITFIWSGDSYIESVPSKKARGCRTK